MYIITQLLLQVVYYFIRMQLNTYYLLIIKHSSCFYYCHNNLSNQLHSRPTHIEYDHCRLYINNVWFNIISHKKTYYVVRLETCLRYVQYLRIGFLSSNRFTLGFVRLPIVKTWSLDWTITFL